MIREIADQRRAIGFAALDIAERVQLQRGVFQDSDRIQNIRPAGQHLDIRLRFGHAQQLDADLVELPLAALLRPLVPKHGTLIEELQRQRLAQPARDQRPRHACRAFRAQGDLLTAIVGEGVHLLRDHVRAFAERALEHFRELENRGLDLAEPIALRRSERRIDDMAMAAGVLRQQVMGAANGLKLRHLSRVSGKSSRVPGVHRLWGADHSAAWV